MLHEFTSVKFFLGSAGGGTQGITCARQALPTEPCSSSSSGFLVGVGGGSSQVLHAGPHAC